MRQTLLKVTSVFALNCILSVQILAQEEASDRPDARLEGYQVGNQPKTMKLEKGDGNAATWFILAGLGVLGLGVMFKPGKRSHLD